jgi:5'-nucleotidase
MNNPRRVFLNRVALITGAVALSKPLTAAAAITKKINTLHAAKSTVTVYHTNDLNGNIDAADKNIGGLLRIKTVLEDQAADGLVLDGGSFINASNSLTQQKQVIYMMNAMRYHAAAVGGQELLNGQDHLASLVPLMQFTLVNCNLQFDNKLGGLVKPYIIINSGKYKIGITGVCRQVKGIKYNNAIESANNVARLLKEDKKCDLVICLSHLGHNQEGNRPDNQKLAEQSENIDMIIGGQNNKLLSNTFTLKNRLKHEVILAQTAFNGLTLGRTIISLDNEKQKSGIKGKHFIPGLPANQPFTPSFAGLQQDKNLYLPV